MTDYNDGKIHGWNGGECPVHPESEVMVWYRGNTSSKGFRAKSHSWQYSKSDGDIVCFQVTKPYAEPKVIWVNEYHYGARYGYDSEELAKSRISISAVRIAVKYVEAKE